MNSKKEIRPYNQWTPIITPEEVFKDITAFGHIKVVSGKIYWSELRPSEGGRIAVVCQDEDGKIQDVLPKDVNVRTRVHEYGGLAFTVDEKNIYYVNFKCQRLFRKQLGDESPPIPLTPEKNADGSLGKYAAPYLTPDQKTLIFVYEKDYEDRENENYIAKLDVTVKETQEPTIIVRGKDFYFDPIISPNGTKIAWLQYNHPNMPWNSTELILADWNDQALPESEKLIVGGEGISICAIRFDRNDRLYFVMDEANQVEENPRNWWNLYRYDEDYVEALTQEMAEFAYPMWVFGYCDWTFLPSGRIIANYERKGRGFLALVDPITKVLETLNSPFEGHINIQGISENQVAFIGYSNKKPSSLVILDLQTMEFDILRTSSQAILSEEDISIPRLLEYPTSDGSVAFGKLYLPKSSQFNAPENDKPPLIIMVHGGPTARAEISFSLAKQFWTSQGYAILDVDHRGSTSYGRKYRDALKDQWGVIDAQDITDGVDYLVNEGIVAQKVAIRGGSAGGYAVQRALTLFPDTFHVGASYFGIGNLITLVKLTHKFESRYIDWLMGAKLPEGEAVYNDRSPINHMDKLKAPMILFQGKDDKIVTPEVSREVVEQLKQRGIPHEYVEYEGESHGFRKKENNIDALSKEAAFFRKVLFP